jgi:fermentation-respiration switch protein FrsA (DUF1100 family)
MATRIRTSDRSLRPAPPRGSERSGRPVTRRPPYGPVAAVAGVVAVPVGMGLGLPYLREVGLAPVTVVALAVLAGGVALLALAAWRAVRALPPGRAILTSVGLVLAVAMASLTLGQAVAAVQVPRAQLGSTTPADRGFAHRDVEFRTTDGVRLSGWYIASRNGAAVALLHGAHSTRSAVLDHAVVLARRGFGVLLFDARGHGRSAGRAMEFGWYGDEDVSAAVSFLLSQPDVSGGRIGVVGMSMGGEEAIGSAAADVRVRAVVAEGATNRVAADKAWLSDSYGRRGDVQRGLEWLTYGVTDLLTPASPPISLREAVSVAAPRPVLLVAAGERPDEGTANRYVAAGSPSTVQVWEVPGASHTGGLRTRPLEWEQRVTTFLTTALDAAPPPR